MSTVPVMPGQDQGPQPGQITAHVKPPAPLKSQEPSQDAPSPQDQNDEMLRKYGKQLIDLCSKKRQEWSWKRLMIVPKVLTNKEMLKGNQHMGVYPGSYESFDALEEFNNWTAGEEKNGDRSMDRRPHNFYQMLEKAFVAALSAQIPKTRWSPANADDEEDRETAKVASRVEEIIERANKAESMLMQKLMELFTSGCYFVFTRYVVDSDRTGTHKESVLQLTKAEVLPARYQCFNCGQSTPEDALVAQQSLACPHCGTPFGPQNYFPNHIEEIPIANQKEDVPNGMVLQSVYGPMHVDADPDAPDLLNTPLLNVAEEVSLGWLRQTFDKFWDKFQEGGSSDGTSTEMLDKQYRDLLTTPAGYNGASFAYTNQTKPTYNRTWIQPMLFAEIEGGKQAYDDLVKQFPKGCMLAYYNDIPLQLRPAKLTDEWTWNGSEQKGFGLFPPPIGDPAVPIQQRLNDCYSKIDEYFDRLACGILLANEQYIDSKAMNGKSMLPGILNPIITRKGAPPGDIANMIFQVKAEIDSTIFQYASTLKQDMELIVGTPPQLFGAGTQQGVETATGQKQQQQQGQVKLGLNWFTICNEHAESAENAIKCAAQNMTDKWFMAVSDETDEFRNEYVHLDQMKGTVHAERDTDQGFPMTSDEIRDWWNNFIATPNEAILDALLSEPENMEACVRAIGVPGLVAPKGAVRGKMLRTINQLVNGKAVTQPDPVTNEPIQIPSIQPNKYLDDCATLTKLIPAWSDAHWDQIENNQNAIDNLVAFYKLCVVYDKELQAETQLTGPGQPDQTQPQQAGAQS